MLQYQQEGMIMNRKLWTKNFTLLISATTMGAIGAIAGGFALSFLVFDETGSTLAASLILAIQMIPGFLIPTFLAPWMDRYPRKPFLVAGDLINGILYAGAGIYLLCKPFTFFGYMGFSLLLSCMGSFDSLAYNSIYPNLIPEGMEEKGYAVSATLYPVLNVLMMPLAALLMEHIGVAWILIGQGVLSILAAALESRIRLVEETRMEQDKYTAALWFADFKDGLSYLKKEKGLQGIYAYMAVTNGVAQGYGPLMVAFFRTAPGLSSVMYAMFSVAEFLGRTIGGFFSYHLNLKPEKKYGFSFLVYHVYETMDMCLLWLPYPLMLINRGICGFLGVNSATMRQAAVQKYIPDHYRARVNAFQDILILAVGSVLSFVIGTLGEFLDFRICMTLCGGFCLAVCWGTIWHQRNAIRAIYES